jgi:hypothetical protein
MGHVVSLKLFIRINNLIGARLMDNNTHINFDMGSVLNKLRSIAEEAPENAMVNDSNFTNVMSRLTSVKDALPGDQFDNLRAGIRSMYMNQRPSQAQMMALLGLLETVLGLIASDNSLFQRLKGDLVNGKKQAQEPGQTSQTAQALQPDSEPQAAQVDEPKVQPGMRGLK